MSEKWEKLHNQAMELSDVADAFRRDKDSQAAQDSYRRAMEKEREAALGYRSEPDAKPASVAILLRSAATLAMDAGDWRESEKLIGLALSADIVPPSVAEELRDLNETVNFHRHLGTRNITLSDAEVQLSLSGDGVSFGMVQSDDFLDRGEALQDLLYREAEHQTDQPYRRGGHVVPALREQFAVYLSVPRGGSFAVTYRIGVPQARLDVDAPLLDPKAVMDAVTENLQLFDNGSEKELQTRFSDAYLRNFLKQAKRLAPDGNRITQVGLTTSRGGVNQPLALRRVVQRQPRHSSVQELDYVGQIVEVKDRGNDSNVNITLLIDNGDKIPLVCAKPQTAIALNLFQKRVRVLAKRENRIFRVQKIEATK